jgi:hypothetical protein
MVRKNWILVGCVMAVAVLVCAVTYAEKSEKCSLPTAVESAVKALFSKAVIESSKKEEASICAYEVELKDNGKPASVNVGENGMVIEVETTVDMSALPDAVKKTLKAQDVNVPTVDKAVTYAELKLVKLDAPVTTYEVKVTKDGKESEIKIAADGKILKQEAVEKVEKDEKGGKEEKKCGKEKDEDDKDEKHEQK